MSCFLCQNGGKPANLQYTLYYYLNYNNIIYLQSVHNNTTGPSKERQEYVNIDFHVIYIHIYTYMYIGICIYWDMHIGICILGYAYWEMYIEICTQTIIITQLLQLNKGSQVYEHRLTYIVLSIIKTGLLTSQSLYYNQVHQIQLISLTTLEPNNQEYLINLCV